MTQRVDALGGLTRACFAPEARWARGLIATVYALLAALAWMQLVNPGTVGRISAQPLGLALLYALCFSLLLSALFVLGSRAVLGPNSAVSIGFGDLLLHFSLGMAGVNFLFSSRFVSDSDGALWIGGFGLVTAGIGAYLAASSARPTAELNASAWADRVPGRRTLRGRQLVGSGVFIAVGALLFVTAMDTLSCSNVGSLEDPIAPWLLAGAAFSLTTYALNIVRSLLD